MRRNSRAVIVAALAAWVMSGAVMGHEPTPSEDTPQYGQYAHLQYGWRPGSVPPGWMDHLIVASGESADDSNGSKAPTFAFTGSGAGEIGYRAYDDGPCVPPQLACAAKFYGGTNDWRITFVKQNQSGGTFTVRWCENTSGGADCWHVERLGIHEFGHILDLGHNGSSVQNTIMQGSIPAFSSTDKLKRCDKARLQLKYDVPTPYSGYADCFDHITGGGGGLLTSASIGASDTSVCQGDTVRFDGRLKVRNAMACWPTTPSPAGPSSSSAARAPADLSPIWALAPAPI